MGGQRDSKGQACNAMGVLGTGIQREKSPEKVEMRV